MLGVYIRKTDDQPNPGTGTSIKNGYSIVVMGIEKDPFSKDIFSNFTPFLYEKKEKSEVKFILF